MRRLPHENYIALLLLRGYSENQVLDELEVLSLPLPDVELIDFLRRHTPQYQRKGEFKPTKVLKEWAVDHLIDVELLNIHSRRVQRVRRIRFKAKLVHLVEICLMNPRLGWNEIVNNLQWISRPDGVDEQLIQDYQTLFWTFDHVPFPERMAYLKENCSTGTLVAQRNPQMGLALDFGESLYLSDMERLSYLADIATLSVASSHATGRLNAADFKDWAATLMLVLREKNALQQETADHLGTHPEDDGKLLFDDEYIDVLPYIDDVQPQEFNHEPSDRQGDLIPFPRR